jgi:hypothetical protein
VGEGKPCRPLVEALGIYADALAPRRRDTLATLGSERRQSA